MSTCYWDDLPVSTREAIRDEFDATAESGPVTLKEIRGALWVAAAEFDAESYDSRPFYRLIHRLYTEGLAP